MKSIIVGGAFFLGILVPTLPTSIEQVNELEEIDVEMYDAINLPGVECIMDAPPEVIRQNYEQFALECINRSHKWFII